MIKITTLAAVILTGTIPLQHAFAADLDAINVTVNDRTPDPGDTVTVRWTAISNGDRYIGSTSQGVMLSSNTTISRGDTLLEREPLGPLGGVFAESSPETRVVTIPSWVVPGRTYYIGVYADYDRERSESNESNNGSNAVSITIRAPDLDAIDLTVNDSTPDPGDLVTVRWTAISYGDIPVGSTDQGVMLSEDNIIRSGGAGETLLEREPLGRLGGVYAQSSSETRVITIPDWVNPGQTYYIGVWADINGERAESNETNNGSNAVAITIRGPDLVAESLTASSSTAEASSRLNAWPGQNLRLSWTARNRGTGSTALLDFSQQAVRWSDNQSVTTGDEILEREPLGILVPGDDSPELRTVKVPADVVPGQTYYLAIEADTDGEFRELDESNNFSNVIEVTIVLPAISSDPDLSDYNYLPYLEGEGFEKDDPRLKDRDGDGDPDPGATMNRSRCFAPGDRAFVHVDVAYDSDYTTLFNGTEPTRLKAYYNHEASENGATYIGSTTFNVGSGGKRLNLGWNVPSSPGDYYVLAVVEVQVDGQWYELRRSWIDEGNAADPVTVSDKLPIVLVHGWSDVSGDTFEDLEFLIETLWKRPVRFFQYETDNTVDILIGSGFGNGPRVDRAYTDLSGETKPSLAQQMEEFLADPEGDATVIRELDVIAHSMGGLVARNYALREGKVRRMVTMGTPSYGGLFADNIIGDAIFNNQAEDLEFGCAVSWKLHREWKDRREDMPDLLTIIGTDDLAFGKYNQSDTLVTCSSASLEGLGFPAYYVPLTHSGDDDGMTKILDTTHPSWTPLREFLNTESCILPGNLPGHAGGADDVGDRNHPDPLRNGAVYILEKNGGGNPVPVTSVDLGHTPSWLPISSSGIHEDGIYFANLVGADSEFEGTEFVTSAAADITVSSRIYSDRLIKVKAGETTVYVINGNNNEITDGDLDGDLLPDCIENLIIDADSGDSYQRQFDVLPGGDFDGDGLPELVETALGTSPTVANFDVFETEVRNGRLILRHDEAFNEFGLEIVGEQSADLVNWSTQGVTGTTVATRPDGRTREWSVPINGSCRFLRILVRER